MMSKNKLFSFCAKWLLLFLIMFCFLTGGEVLAEKPEWQIEAEAVTVLGVRDKYGALGSFTAEFVVTAADGKSAKVRKNGRGNEFCEVRFPYDFKGPATMATGNFSYKILANGNVIAVGTFEYRASEVKVGIPKFP
jgi:hypothetical protein